MGYGIICTHGNSVRMLATGILKLDSDTDHSDRLKKIFETLLQIIEEHHPDELAIEEPFYGKNVQSMLKLGRAQGVMIAAALHRQIPVFGYSPKKIKQSITGRGSKVQVAAMLKQILKFDRDPEYHDATDALATALCHYYQGSPADRLNDNKSGTTSTSKKKNRRVYDGWDSFLKENPQRSQ